MLRISLALISLNMRPKISSDSAHPHDDLFIGILHDDGSAPVVEPRVALLDSLLRPSRPNSEAGTLGSDDRAIR